MVLIRTTVTHFIILQCEGWSRAVMVLIRTTVTHFIKDCFDWPSLICSTLYVTPSNYGADQDYSNPFHQIVMTVIQKLRFNTPWCGETQSYRWTEAFIFQCNNLVVRCWHTQVRERLVYAKLGKIDPQRIKLSHQTTSPLPPVHLYFY